MDPIGEQVGTESDSLNFANAALATGVTRRRQRTEKGKAFIAHVRWTDCQTLFRRIQRQIKEIDSLATNEENVDIVERNLTLFRFSVEELKAGFAAVLNDLESEENLGVANEWYVNLNGRINDFLDKTVLWISTAKEKIEHSLETRSQVGSLYIPHCIVQRHPLDILADYLKQSGRESKSRRVNGQGCYVGKKETVGVKSRKVTPRRTVGSCLRARRCVR